MNWLRSVVAVGGGFLVVLVVMTAYVVWGRPLGSLIQHLLEPYQLGDDTYSRQGEMIYYAVGFAITVIPFVPGGFVAALLAPARRLVHGLAVGLVALSIVGILWLRSPSSLEPNSLLPTMGVFAGCALGAFTGQWLANRVVGGSVEPPRAASLDGTQS